MNEINLEPKHIKWIVDATLKHFKNEIKENEMEIIRHSFFENKPNYGEYIPERINRVGVANRLIYVNEQYTMICNFLITLREKVSDIEIDNFMNQMNEYLKKKENKKHNPNN